ncbi:ribonuclease H2 subunit A-like [Zingiber officinale]|uniref:ribonuclease H2 subunit A-like n=1 Tax=Zingiber officinale TaxID=94328 RepID=UPI001C4AFAD0|nr:ribonuclease H2 subunit A-like [Zingiber officinale]
MDLHTRVAVILNQDAITEMGYGHSFCNDYSKTHREEKREELFENLKLDDSIGWEVDVIDPWELSAKMLKRKRRFDGKESLWKINMS